MMTQTKLYATLTGKQARVPAFHPIRWQSIPQALDMVIESELEAYEKYRDLFLSTRNPAARDILLRAYTDKAEHAIRFTHQRIRLCCDP